MSDYCGKDNNNVTNFIYIVTILITFISLLLFTWNTWADPVIDFGREVYIPWQITQGQHLYKDLAYFNGPLSPYFNAMIFKMFGSNLHTIFITNIFLLILFLIILWKLIYHLSDRFTAFIGTIVTICVFSFNQTTTISNYNFIAPYSHEMTHGIILSITSVFLLFFGTIMGI